MLSQKNNGGAHLNIAEQSFNLNKLDVRVTADRAFVADVSDIHVGNIYHNRTKFEDFLSKVKSIDNLYLIIGGDSTDNATTSSASSVFEQSEHGGDQVLTAYKLLEPLKDRILFCRSGNHGYERALKHNRLIPEQMLAELLGVPFYHGMASVFFNVNKNLYVLGTWHNSKKPDKMEWLHTDVTFYEHLHKTTYERTLVAEPNCIAKCWSLIEHYDVQTGSFLGWGGYSADKGYRPNDSGTSVVEFSGERNKKSIRVHDSIDRLLELEELRKRVSDGNK
nr:MAG TPA: metallophosphatase domain protein [Caudoviricetes sp.]